MAIRAFAVVGLLVCAPFCSPGAEPGPGGAAPPTVTNGLIRWWPNLFDARDQVSGDEGVVMGVLPETVVAPTSTEPGARSTAVDAEFGMATGWVQLRPAITNRVFTLAFWMKRQPPDRWLAGLTVLGQHDGFMNWAFRRLDTAADRYAVTTGDIDPAEREEFVIIPADGWHHVAVASREDGTPVLWLDGVRKLEGRLRHRAAPASRWLSVGNCVKGDEQWSGDLRDLCAFDRVLRDEEVRVLHAAGLPERPARNTSARLAATANIELATWMTNVAPASGRELIHRRFTTEDGLAGNVVQAVLQAANGFLWVGSEEGLSRFDGRKFEVFNTENTPALRVTGNDIMCLAEAQDGSIWAGAYGGLLRCRRGEFTAFTNGLPELFVVQAEPADDDTLWVAGFRLDESDRGPCMLRRFHPQEGRTDAAVTVPGQPRRLVPVTNGVWIATEKPEALYFWDGKRPVLVAAAMVASAPASVRIGGDALPSGTRCRGWVNPLNELERWAEIQLGPTGPTFHWVWPREPQRPGVARWNGADRPSAWLASSMGLALLGRDRVQPAGLPERTSPPDISCACPNREGGVWFGTEEDGLHFVQERLVQVFTTRDGLGSDDVRALCVGKLGRVWAGSSRWQDGRWETLLPGPISAVAESPEGELWAGCQQRGVQSLHRWRADTASPPRMEAFNLPGLDWADPNSLHFAADGTLWVACARGVTWVKAGYLHGDAAMTGTNGFGRFVTGRELPETITVGLVEDRQGAIWAGTTGKGLIHIRDKRVKLFTKRDGLAGDFCVPALADDSGALWIVTDGGISRRKDGRFQNIRPADGLPHDLFSDLVQDDHGHFWLPGKRGIHCVVRAELEAFLDGRADHVHSITLGMRDGLLTPECASQHYPVAARTPDGRIWVATHNGVAMINPARVRLDLQPMPTLLEQLVVNRKDYPLPAAVPRGKGKGRTAETLRLPAGSGRRLEFHFTSISLTAAERVRFKYRLDGYDADWSPETDLRLAFYTNLRPGPYRFRVMAANAHGVWNEEAATLSFAVAPYVWETTTFWVVLALAIAAIALLLHRNRLRVVRRLQELNHEQALADEKARIAADMHDELGATLTQIVLLGESAHDQVADVPRTRATLERMAQAARDVTSSMSDLIWVINPRHDTLDNLAAFLREHAARQFEGTAIHARLDFEPPPAECHVSATFRRNVVLVVKEALHNVLKHSGATELHFRLGVAGNDLVLHIEDNGRGFDLAGRTGAGNGLGNMRQRLRDLGGVLEIETAPGRGTRICLSAPLSASA